MNKQHNKVNIKKELAIKIVVCGGKSVGKTALLQRYSDNSYDHHGIKLKPTIVYDILSYSLNNYPLLDKSSYKLILKFWDVSYLEAKGKHIDLIMSNIDGIIFVTDHQVESLNYIDIWRNYVSNIHIPMILLMNKYDIYIEDDIDLYNTILDSYCYHSNILQWYYTSAKTNINVSEAFELLIDHAIQNKMKSNNQLSSNGI